MNVNFHDFSFLRVLLPSLWENIEINSSEMKILRERKQVIATQFEFNSRWCKPETVKAPFTLK